MYDKLRWCLRDTVVWGSVHETEDDVVRQEKEFLGQMKKGMKL